MITAHYANRLPEKYDLGRIRALTKERGPIWDARPELYFKAFLLREAERFGAIANSFSSLYLWRQDGAYENAVAYQIFHLARPLLDTLPKGDDR
jgi:Domain of unknown function (DUF4865)